MKNPLRKILTLFKVFGVDFQKMIQAVAGLPRYFGDWLTLRGQAGTAARKFRLAQPYPCLVDWYEQSGGAMGYYFHQDLLVARRVHQNQPEVHVDVGSSIPGFVAHVAAFRKITVLDIRPLTTRIPNVEFRQADVMNPVGAELMACCDSLSCLHVIEHFGLGRYGDPVTYDGHLRGMENLHRMLKPGGRLYFSGPIGPQRIEFNAHRVFAVGYLLEQFAGKYRVERFSFVNDHGDFHEDVPLTEDAIRENYGCRFGCGIFEMIKT